MSNQKIHPESHLVILNTFHKHNGKRNILWCKCLCTACGNEVEIRKGDVFGLTPYGGIKSCGCVRGEILSRSNSKKASPGSRKSPEYFVWVTMRQRCNNPNSQRYASYGGRGINVCPEWLDNFDAFIRDMGPRPSSGHSLDRIDNDKGYSPDNCRWATKREQSNNTRRNVIFTHEGKKQTLKQWASQMNMNYGTLVSRASKGLTPETGLFDPPKKKSSESP